MSAITVAGAGAFGTALAVSLARDGRKVTLWARDAGLVARLRDARCNTARLPDVDLPEALAIDSGPEALGAPTVLLCVPTQSLGAFLSANAGGLTGRRLVLCCKGIDRGTGLRPSELVSRARPGAEVSVLTGPSFAQDIARGLPTALTLATRTGGEALQRDLSTSALRPYLTDDIVGAELGGALKNVIALAAGLTIGAGLGESARAAVVTRGFAEIVRFAVGQGARPETLAGLSGLGDLVLTCTSEKSRNFSAGRTLGAGGKLPHGQTIEGLATAEAVSAIARDAGIDMPLAAMVAAVTNGRLTVHAAAEALMSRPLRKE